MQLKSQSWRNKLLCSSLLWYPINSYNQRFRLCVKPWVKVEYYPRSRGLSGPFWTWANSQPVSPLMTLRFCLFWHLITWSILMQLLSMIDRIEIDLCFLKFTLLFSYLSDHFLIFNNSKKCILMHFGMLNCPKISAWRPNSYGLRLFWFTFP